MGAAKDTLITYAAVAAMKVAGDAYSSWYRASHPVPTRTEWDAMWRAGDERDREAMLRWSQRWTYPTGEDRKRLDALRYHIRSEANRPHIAWLEHQCGIGDSR